MSARSDDADLIVAFLNTLDVETATDELSSETAWVTWAQAGKLPPAGPLATARAARDALREAAAGESPDDLLVDVRVGVVEGRPHAVATDAVGAILLAAARLADAGQWTRVKLCAAETCRWAFVDESRNRSRAWCSMEVCGNRAKARAFRRRARGPQAHSD